MRGFYSRLALFFLIAPVFIFPFITVKESIAQGSLMVFPTRIVFEGRTRSEKVTLINRGTKSAKYRISFQNKRMTPEGGFKDIENTKDALPGEKFSDGLIRYSPRQIEIAPGASQIIRLLLRKKSNLPPGEYRSHMFFSSLPPEDTGENIESLAPDNKEFSIKLTPLYGITIPVIVRHGSTSATAELGDIKLKYSQKPDDEYRLSFPINRGGDQSLYGDISVKFTPEDGGGEVEVARVNGLAVYAPNKSRNTAIKLNLPPGLKLERGILKVIYSAESDFSVEKELKLP